MKMGGEKEPECWGLGEAVEERRVSPGRGWEIGSHSAGVMGIPQVPENYYLAHLPPKRTQAV